MESILNASVAMGIEEGPVLFQMTAKLMVQALCKGKECSGKACKDKKFKAYTYNCMVYNGNASYDNVYRDYASMGKAC
jgi:hypothetical protein